MAASSTTTTTTGEIKKMVTLKMSNNDEFYLEESLAFQSELFKNMMIEEEGVSIIPLPTNIKRGTVVTIIEYLKKHAEINVWWSNEFMNFKKEYLSGDFDELKDITLFAKYFKIEDLKKIGCLAIADNIKSKSMNTIRELFGFEDDLTPEEKAEIIKENAWAFE